MGIFSRLFGSKPAEMAAPIVTATNEEVKKFSGYYRDSQTSRLQSDWISSAMPTPTPPSYELTQLRMRSRDLMRNDSVFSAIVSTLITNIIGEGLSVQAAFSGEELGISQKKADKLKEAIETAFEEWTEQADIAGIVSFQEMQRIMVERTFVDGESLSLFAWNDKKYRSFGTCIRLIENDSLILTQAFTKSNDSTVNGITFDPKTGEPLTYWLALPQKTAMGFIYNYSDMIPVKYRDSSGRLNVLHVFETTRPNQTRGVPKFAPVLGKFSELNEYLEAELVSARISACLSVFVQKTDPMSAATAMSNETDAEGYRLQELEPGVINYLAPGETINIVDPKRTDSLGTFTEAIMRIIGMSVGIPYESFTKDFSKTSYSSARASLLEARKEFTKYRTWFVQKAFQPIYERVVEEAYLSGKINVPNWEANKKKVMKAKWSGAPFGQIDEMKETQASILRLAAGLTTYERELAASGLEYDAVFNQYSREQEMIKELGIDLTLAAKKPAGKPDDGGETEAGGPSNA